MDPQHPPGRPFAIAARRRAGRIGTTSLALLIVAVALWRFLAAIPASPYHPDESRWIAHAAALGDLRHPLGSAWGDRLVTRDQTPFAAYLLGLGLAAQGRPLGAVGWWNFSQDGVWNVAHGNMPSRAYLVAARRVDAVLGALTVLAIFLLVTRLANRVGGVAAGLFLIGHPLMILLSSRVGSDAALVLLIALAALALTRLAAAPTWRGAALVGLILGLGAAVKISPLFVAVILAGYGLVLLSARPGGPEAARRRAAGWMLLAQPAIAAAVFVAVSPFLWSDPIGRTRNLFAFRLHEMANQAKFWPRLRVSGLSDALSRVWNLLGATWTTSGWLTRELDALTGGSWRLSGVDVALGVAGLLILVGAAIRRGATSEQAFAALLLLATAAVTLAGMRVSYGRYFLPLVVVLAVGVGEVVGAAWAVLAGRGVSRPRESPVDLPLWPAS